MGQTGSAKADQAVQTALTLGRVIRLGDRVTAARIVNGLSQSEARLALMAAAAFMAKLTEDKEVK